MWPFGIRGASYKALALKTEKQVELKAGHFLADLQILVPIERVEELRLEELRWKFTNEHKPFSWVWQLPPTPSLYGFECIYVVEQAHTHHVVPFNVLASSLLLMRKKRIKKIKAQEGRRKEKSKAAFLPNWIIRFKKDLPAFRCLIWSKSELS